MENLLLLVHRIPYPPNKGDKIRSYHLLKHLAQNYRVHLATFIDDAEDWQHVPRVKAFCAESHFVALNPLRGRIRSIGALLGNRSLSPDYYQDGSMRAWVAGLMQRQTIDRILVFSSVMAQYAAPYTAAQRVVDFVDVDSDKWRQYAEKKSWPMNWLFRHEARQLLAYERAVARQSDACLFVSEPEAQLFRQLAPESAAKTGFVSMGVDADFYSPEHVFDNPFPAASQTIVFTGAMDYWPNIDAVQWFVTSIFPTLRATYPDLVFAIVGARPAPAVKALEQEAGVVVTGRVADVRPYLAHAALSVAPLRVARGVQSKVLEAMSMAKTVVVSPQALEGIDASPGSELLLAEDAQAFAATVSAALARPDPTMGSAARARVLRDYSWTSNLSKIDTLLEAGVQPDHKKDSVFQCS